MIKPASGRAAVPSAEVLVLRPRRDLATVLGEHPDAAGQAWHLPNDPDVRAVLEMAYLFEEPFVVDSAKITDKPGVGATPLDQALDETLATYRGSAP